jgi:hypothetical protein
MRLEPLYCSRFSTPERWSVQFDGAHGTETQSLLFAQDDAKGRSLARCGRRTFQGSAPMTH